MLVSVKCSLSLWSLSQIEDTNLTQFVLQGFLQERETEKENSSRQRTTASELTSNRGQALAFLKPFLSKI